MGLLTPSKNERLLLQKQFAEKCRMIGVDGFYYEVKDLNLSVTSKWDNIHYFDPIPISFLFEDMPNPKTLRNLHWWDDNDDTTPPIAYLPWHINGTAENRSDSTYELKPTIGSKLELPDPLGGESRFYEIVEVNANTIYMIYSIVKLTPLRQSLKIETERFDTQQMEVNEAPTSNDEDLSTHSTDYQFIKKPEPKEEPKRPDSGYTFFNVDGRINK